MTELEEYNIKDDEQWALIIHEPWEVIVCYYSTEKEARQDAIRYCKKNYRKTGKYHIELEICKIIQKISVQTTS